MYRQTYESAVVPYIQVPTEGFVYNPWLITPPRIYNDSLLDAKCLFRAQGGDTLSGYSYGLLSYMSYTNWPSWESLAFSYDPITGAATRYSAIVAPIWLAWTHEIVQDYYGLLWRSDVFGDITPLSFTFLSGQFIISEGTPVPASHFGRVEIRHPIVDVQKNTIAMYGDYQFMYVYAWDSGVLLRKIPLSGDPIAVCAGDQDYAFILTHNNTLDVVNIQTGQVLGVSIMNRVENGTQPLLSWDYRYRRLLIFEKTPDAVDGASTARIRGYYPLAMPTALMNPIPLTAPRINKTTTVISRMVGDVGEPLSNGVAEATLTFTPPTDASLVSVTETTDTNGFISFHMKGIEPGTIEFAVTAEV